MANQTGIAIAIKAFLPTGKTIDEQFSALTMVKNAHASGDYSELLKAAKIDEVKAEQKTRRVEEPEQTDPASQPAGETEPEPKPESVSGEKAEAPADEDAGIPALFKKDHRKAKAA